VLTDIKPFKDIKKGARITLPHYERKWEPPKDFPNLSGVQSLAVDTETYDPELRTIGPGWGRGVGHIVGASIATEDAAWYFPVRHTIDAHDNMDPEQVFRFLKDNLETESTKIFANAVYDCGWLRTEGIHVKGTKYDVQYAEAILDGNAYSYALETIANNYIGSGKTSNDLYDWCARSYGGQPNGDQRANIYRSPPTLVGPYAESDADLPFRILRKQWVQLDLVGLVDIFKLECELLDLLVDMRWRGMRVSEERAHIAEKKLTGVINNIQQELNELAGFRVNANSGKTDLVKLYDQLGVEYNYTEKGNPSFTRDWLEQQVDDASTKVVDIRKYTKARDTFLRGAILEKHTNGYVHPSFYPLKGESGGAVTGRFAAAGPPIQQIPSRDQILAPIIRSCFIPEDGMSWVKADYSSIELRMMAHYSEDKALIKSYTDNPFMDYHDYVGEILGGKLPRIAVKTLNFSLIYGGGKRTISVQMARIFNKAERMKLIKDLGFPVLTNTAEQLAVIFMNIYSNEFPIAGDLLNSCSQAAAHTGQMRTILNRRTTFDLWEPIKGKGIPLRLDAALARYGKMIKRAYTYKALNYRLQGSAADLIKKGMVAAYKEGLFDHIPLHGQVHDELCLSYHPDLNSKFRELTEIMETAINFKVPIIMDAEYGPSWAEAKTKIDIGERTWIT